MGQRETADISTPYEFRFICELGQSQHLKHLKLFLYKGCSASSFASLIPRPSPALFSWLHTWPLSLLWGRALMPSVIAVMKFAWWVSLNTYPCSFLYAVTWAWLAQHPWVVTTVLVEVMHICWQKIQVFKFKSIEPLFGMLCLPSSWRIRRAVIFD